MIKKVKEAYTICTHGTLFSHEKEKGANLNYYFDSTGKRDDTNYTKEFAELLGANRYRALYIKWSGNNTLLARLDAADKIYRSILPLGEGIKINLIGHSHGGNIMIMVANMIKKYHRKDIEICNLITLSTPVREYKLHYELNHIQFFSYFDIVQNVGFIDIDKIFRTILIIFLSSFLALPCILWPKHTMKRAKNISVTMFNNKKIRKMVKKGIGTGIIYQHQAVMFMQFMKEVFKKEGL